MLATHPAGRIEDAVADVLPKLEGAFSTVVLTGRCRGRIPRPVRDPAAVARGDRGRAIRADLLRGERDVRVRPDRGSTPPRRRARARSSTLGPGGVQLHARWRRAPRPAFCVFEHIYFARPDSRMGGNVLQVARGRMGEILWREAPVDADVVIAVPDSGNAAARGLARASGLPQDDGFIKNRYVARTFIQPGQQLRRQGLRLKFNPLPEVVGGKRLVVVDDSIVRGNTTRQIVACCGTPARRRSTCASRRRRRSIPAITGSTCRRGRR